MDTMIRARTVAVAAAAVVVVAAVMLTLMATRAWSVDAAPGDTDSTFVPTPGCRLADTRPAPNNVGDRATPLLAGGIFEVTVHGSNGGCTGALAVPSDAVAVALNVTAVNATATSNIRFYPANLTGVPLLSNLNVSAGAPAIPNKVDVQLSPGGDIKVFNEFGSVNVIIDLVGYYTNSSLQDLSAELEVALARIDVLEATTASNTSAIATNTAGVAAHATDIAALDEARPFAISNRDDNEFVGSTDEVVVSVAITATVAGQVTVNSTTNAFNANADNSVRCSITTITALDSNYIQRWEAAGSAGSISQLAGTRTFDIAAGATDSYNLVCDHIGASGASQVLDSVLTAIFTPAP